MIKLHEIAEALLPEASNYEVTERNTKVKHTYLRYDRLICIAVTDGYEGLYLNRVVDISWYKSTTVRYPSVKTNQIIYCHVYIKNVGHAWGYCGGASDVGEKATYALQDALTKMGVGLLDDEGNEGSIGGCGAASVLSAVRAIARKAEPRALSMEVFD